MKHILTGLAVIGGVAALVAFYFGLGWVVVHFEPYSLYVAVPAVVLAIAYLIGVIWEEI
jgi:hypothetical protein